MLDRKELKEIAQMRDDTACFVSLYLNVNPLTNPKGEQVIQFKNMLKNTIETLDKDIYKLVKDDLQKIESSISGSKREFKKGLVLLSSAGRSFWREYHLSVSVKSDLIVGKSPYIKPLLDILDQYQRYVVLLVDKESARIFTIHLGEIVEYGEVHTQDIPGKHKKGGWFALSQNHYERHIDYHVGLHLKDVLKKLDSFISGEQITGLVIGASDETVSKTKGMLSVTVINKIVGTFHAEMFAKSGEVIAKVEPLISSYEKRKKDEMVDRLITHGMKNEKAVLGLENVLNALQEGKVMELVFLRDFNPLGHVCKSCGFMSIQDLKQCPYCKRDMERANFIVEMAAQKAVEQGAVVEVVIENKKFSDSGGIGAMLRF